MISKKLGNLDTKLRGSVFSTNEKRMIPSSFLEFPSSKTDYTDALSFLNTDDYF